MNKKCRKIIIVRKTLSYYIKKRGKKINVKNIFKEMFLRRYIKIRTVLRSLSEIWNKKNVVKVLLMKQLMEFNLIKIVM